MFGFEGLECWHGRTETWEVAGWNAGIEGVEACICGTECRIAGPGPGGAGVRELECWASGEECGARSSRMLGWEE